MHSVCIVTKGHWNACMEAQKKKKCYCVLCGDFKFKAYIPVGVKSLCNCLFTAFLLTIKQRGRLSPGPAPVSLFKNVYYAEMMSLTYTLKCNTRNSLYVKENNL